MADVRHGLVAQELRLAFDLDAGGEIDAELARGLRLLALHVHRALVAFHVDGEPALARDVGREIGREPVGVVQLEDGVAVDDLGAAELRDGGVENRHARLERARELLAFLAQHVAHERLPGDELGIRLAHDFRERGHELVEERGAHAELVAVAHRAPRDAAQHVAAALVRRAPRRRR